MTVFTALRPASLALLLLAGRFSADAQAPASPAGSTAAVVPTAAVATARAPAADSGAVLVYGNWYLPAYRRNSGAADTTGALLSLFRKRRYAGFLFAAPLIVGFSLALPIASTNAAGQRTVAAEAISPPLGTAVLLGTVAAFVLHANKFSKARLVTTDKAYALGQPLPRKYRSQLNASHFAEALLLREALAQQMAREQQAVPER